MLYSRAFFMIVFTQTDSLHLIMYSTIRTTILQYMIFRLITLFFFTGVVFFSCSSNRIQVPSPNQHPQLLTKNPVAAGQWKNVPVHRLYSSFIVSGAAVEMYELEWPSDNLLCDTYTASAGGLTYRVYRMMESKKIIYVTETGYYCQGDSEYSYAYMFDENGNAIYSIAGGNIYYPTTIRFYEEGKPALEIEYGAAEGGPPGRTIKDPANTDVVTASDFERKISTYRQQMRDRAEILKTLQLDSAERREADSLVQLLEASLNQEITYQRGYEYRKAYAIGGETTRLNETEISVRISPNVHSEIIGKVSCYDINIQVIGMKDPINVMDPYGNHYWYQIRYTDANNRKLIEGWISGDHLAEGVYPYRN